MKLKEALGIGIGILFFAAAIYGLILGSKDDQKGRTEPVAQFTWQKATFANQDLNKIVEDMQLEYIHGFLFRKDSLTPVYYPFDLAVIAKTRHLIYSELKHENGRYEIDFADLEKKLLGG